MHLPLHYYIGCIIYYCNSIYTMLKFRKADFQYTKVVYLKG